MVAESSYNLWVREISGLGKLRTMLIYGCQWVPEPRKDLRNPGPKIRVVKISVEAPMARNGGKPPQFSKG